MSAARSSKAGLALATFPAICCIAGLLLFGCDRGGGSTVASQSAKSQGAVGYIRMDDLVKVHPLYGQLARLDDDMAAIQLKSIGTGPTLAPAALRREQVALQREFQQASQSAKPRRYARRSALPAARRARAALRFRMKSSSNLRSRHGPSRTTPRRIWWPTAHN